MLLLFGEEVGVGGLLLVEPAEEGNVVGEQLCQYSSIFGLCPLVEVFDVVADVFGLLYVSDGVLLSCLLKDFPLSLSTLFLGFRSRLIYLFWLPAAKELLLCIIYLIFDYHHTYLIVNIVITINTVTH